MRILKYFKDSLDHWVQNMPLGMLIKRICVYFPLVFHDNTLEVIGQNFKPYPRTLNPKNVNLRSERFTTPKYFSPKFINLIILNLEEI